MSHGLALDIISCFINAFEVIKLNRTTFSCQNIEKDNKNIPFYLVLKLIRNERECMNHRKKTRPMTYRSMHGVVWKRYQWEILVLWKTQSVSKINWSSFELGPLQIHLEERGWFLRTYTAQVWDMELTESLSHLLLPGSHFPITIEGVHTRFWNGP